MTDKVVKVGSGMNRKTGRGVVGLLAAVVGAMLMCALVSVAALANGGEVVSWTPERQTENGVRTATMTVSGGDSGYALVDVPLPAGVTVKSGDADLIPTPLDSAKVPECGGLVLLSNDDSLVLRVVINGATEEATYSLSFSSDAEVMVPASGKSALTQEFADAEALKGGFATLLSGDQGATSVSLTSFTVYPTVPAELTVTSKTDSVDLGTQDANATFEIGVQEHASPDDASTQDYALSLALPEGLSLPDGELSCNGADITCGGVTIVRFTLPGDQGLTVSDPVMTADGLQLTLSVPYVSEEPVDSAYYVTEVTVNLSCLLRVPEAISGSVALSVTPPGEEEPVSSSVQVTAAAASDPGDGGWSVEPVPGQTTSLTQRVIWNDNNSDPRPTWGWDGGENTLAPRLFFTINGVRRELTAQTLSLVGLNAMPSLAEKDGTLTVSGLPKQIKETSAEQDGTTYSVAWTLEAPSSVPSTYTMLNLSEDEVGQGTSYPSVNEGGWYFMLHDTFVLRVDARQGLEGDLTADQVKELLGNFQFEWAYGTNGSGNNNILTMLNEESIDAHFDDESRTVTITGLWAYNVDGGPISYKVSGTDAAKDGKLMKEELDSLGIPDTTLREGDWYAIQYDNAGVPNYGDKTDGVYNGGTLRLVRQGETTYQAAKMWLDSYSQGDDQANRPNVTFTLYRYRRDQGIETVSVVSGVKVEIGSFNEEEGSWEIVARDDSDALVNLERYDAMNGYEWIYVVKETLDDSNYQQVFGQVAVSDDEGAARGEVIPGTDVGPDEEWERPAGNTYLYNGGTLTNQLKDSVTVPATKTWNAASFQASFGDVAVELTLQYRAVGSDSSWADYTYADAEGNEAQVVRYLHNFSSMFLTNSLDDVPSMPKYLITNGGVTQEVEYRWEETAVYANAPNATETSVGDGASEPYVVRYASDSKGTFKVGVESRSYRVDIEVDNGSTLITNTLQDTLDYEVIKKWQQGTNPDAITISLYQTVTGKDFDYSQPYLTFTMNSSDGVVTVTKGSGQAWSAGVELKSGIDGWVDPDDGGTYWPAVVENLPKYNEEGQIYEYLLLENYHIPTYATEILDNGDYRTTVVNGVGEGGFSFMVRKNWLDDSDVQHRETVSFTVYNRHTSKPVQLKNDDGASSDYTLTIENDGVWHQVYWASTANWTDESKQDGNGKQLLQIGANDIYVVETSVGGSSVDYGVAPTFAALYEPASDVGVFDVTTENHRYQVTYDYSSNSGNGVPGTFTVTNRRLGNVDVTVTKKWVDGRLTLDDTSDTSETFSQTLANLVKDIKYQGGANLALVFQLEFNQDAPDSWYIQNTGHLNEEDVVYVGGEKAPIYKSYAEGVTDPDGETWKAYGERGSSQQVIVGLDNNGETVVRDGAYFFGLPKYDSEGNPVKYAVSETWVKLTDDGYGGTKTEPVSLADLKADETSDNLKQLYTQLNNLWSNYRTDVTESYEENHGNASHVRDFQTIEITNTRADTKQVTWTKKWEDEFTDSSGLRPDLYLDVYAVVHKRNEAGTGYVRQIRKVTSTGEWGTSDDYTQFVTLSLPQFDSNGIEITYFAVERTVMSASDYDYTAGKYSIGGTDLGTRDNPSDSAVVLSTASPSGNETTQFTVLNLDATDTDAIGWETPGDKPTNFGVFGNAGGDYPCYALVEGGTFTNALENAYSINGVKYWYNLPSAWEDARLPKVTFSVYRSTTQTVGTSGEPVATLEVSGDLWSQIRQGNSYTYLIEYEGTNTLSVENGTITCTGGADEIRLPRYDEHGSLYYYAVKEEADLSGTDAGTYGGKVFETVGNGFTFTNTYAPDKGSIRVKKFLYLPMTTDGTPESYPAVTFELTRQVENASGSYGNDAAFTKLTTTISSSEVKKAWDDLSPYGKTEGYVTLETGFGDLPLYAPDGSKYLYTVTEVKTQLNGYDTWAETGDKNNPDDVVAEGTAVSSLEPASTDAIAATFKNKQTDEPVTFESLSGTKIWDDFNDKYGFRPTQDSYKTLLILKRSAASQTGQNNAMGPEDVLFKITWTQGSDKNTWDFTINPAGGGTFEKFAPNGMPWRYTLSEPLVGGKLQLDSNNIDSDSNKVYLPSTSGGAWPTTIVDSSQSQQSTSFGTLTNSTSGKAWFEKKWVDADNTPIAEDYLKVGLSVTFKLQVSTDSGSTWSDASTNGYVTGAVDAEYEFEQTKTGAVTGDWEGSFDNLPTIAKDSEDKNVYLEYRVVETRVSYGNTTQTVTIDSDGSYTLDPTNGLVTSATFEKSGNTSVTTNTLATTSVSVTKVWEDGENQYGTRPGESGPWSWSAWFVLQRTTDDLSGEDVTWENVALFEKLYGDNSADSSGATGSWSDTISGLPTMDYSAPVSKGYAYRVQELQPNDNGYTGVNQIAEEDIVQKGGAYNPSGSTYETTYSSSGSDWTVTNKLKTVTNLKAVKSWAHNDKGIVSSVTFLLQYREKGTTDAWQSATFATAEKRATENNGWTVTWEELPSTYDGKEVEYQIVEKAGSGWVQLKAEESPDGDTQYYTYTFTNSVTRAYKVVKVWHADAAPTEGVTVGLFRTTDLTKIGSVSGAPVPTSETETGSQQRTTTLNGDNSWRATFTGLPKYDVNGSVYYYYALELSAGEPVGDEGTVALDGKTFEVTYGFDSSHVRTTVTNTLLAKLEGTKTWKDDSNAYDTRPNNVTLALWRTTKDNPTDGDWTEVADLASEGITFQWTATTGNTWSFAYDNVPQYDAQGNGYTYRVTEVPPAGYVASYDYGTYGITNTLAGTVTINGTKTWVGGKAETEPTLTLYRRLASSTDEGDWQEVSGVSASWDDDFASFTYENLPKYDSEGRLYEYRVREDVPGYEASYASDVAVDATTNAVTNDDGTTRVDGSSITNYKNGELEVKKVVSGNSGEYRREFTFTIGLSGSSSAGTSASSLAGKTFAYVVTNADGAQASWGTIAFVADPEDNGKVVSDEIKLSHGQAIKVTGLPSGIGYEVTELEASKEGYFTSSVGATGTVPAGSAASVEYRNYRHVDETVTVAGTKTWDDDGNALGLRPEDLELRLYCSVSGGEEWLVEGVVPIWVKQGDVWSYSFPELPKYDDGHNEYSYRVEEVVPEGYVGTSEGYDLTNVLIERIDVSGVKTWVGDDPATRPESVTVTLYANGVEVATTTASAASGWGYVFENVPRYDADGNEIVYTVAETPVPEGYVATYDGLNVTNTSSQLVGSLRVTKTVRGEGAETSRDFSFTVTLGDPGVNGSYGDMTFINGVATFTLRHGQSAVAEGLPAGLAYVVRETPAEGYATSATGQQGAVPAGSEALAAFTNSKGGEPGEPSEPSEPDEPVAPEDPGGGVPFSGEVAAPLALVALAGAAALVLSRRLKR